MVTRRNPREPACAAQTRSADGVLQQRLALGFAIPERSLPSPALEGMGKTCAFGESELLGNLADGHVGVLEHRFRLVRPHLTDHFAEVRPESASFLCSVLSPSLRSLATRPIDMSSELPTSPNHRASADSRNYPQGSAGPFPWKVGPAKPQETHGD